jgi:hypothetical protein
MQEKEEYLCMLCFNNLVTQMQRHTLNTYPSLALVEFATI